MASACPEGADAGTEVACSCGDAGTGTATCQANGFPGSCDCDDGAGAGGTSGGSGGAGGNMSGTGGMSGAGGSGGSDDDGGMEPGGDGDGDGDGDASVPPLNLPDDGNQGSVCTNDRDCNRDLGCFNAGQEGQGFCSAECMVDDDCTGIAGASYVCSMSTGVCNVECEGEDDTESCPEPMVCVNTGGFGGGGGGMESFRCKYPDEGEPEPMGGGELFDECSGFGGPGPGGGAEDCGDGLVCTPTGPGTGYCTVECEMPDGDCSALEEAAGDLTPECTTLGGPGGGGGQCTLDCSENEDGCPEGMACIQFGPTSRCGYE